MRLALLSDVFRAQPIEEIATAIAASGFRNVELNACRNWFPHVDFRRPDAERQAAHWRRALDAQGIAIPAVAAFTNLAATDPAERAASVAYCRRALATFPILGSHVLTCMFSGSNHLPPLGQRQAFRASLLDLAEAAALQAANIAVEIYPGNFVEHTVDAVELLASLGAPHVGYLLCVAHLAALGEDVIAAYGRSGTLVRHVHLSDTPRGTPEHQHLVPGLGQVDWTAFCATLRRDAFAGYITAQIYTHKDTPARSCARAYATLRAAIGGPTVSPQAS